MGISIDVKIYKTAELKAKLREHGATDDQLTQNILEACGMFFGDSYVLLNNEYGDGYSPYYNVAQLFDSAFNRDDFFDIFLKSATQGISYVDVGEVAENLGITLRED